jgi:hypothetical protein
MRIRQYGAPSTLVKIRRKLQSQWVPETLRLNGTTSELLPRVPNRLPYEATRQPSSMSKIWQRPG